MVGDLHTVALVGMDGSIDFMCFPHFDSPTLFAALLDHRKGGRFQVAPTLKDAHAKQLYLPDSNILLTRFLSHDGVAEISDFMTICDGPHTHDLVRRAKTVRGKLKYRMVFAPAFDYGRAGHRIKKEKNALLFISEGSDGTVVRLRSDVPVKIEEGAAVAEFVLSEGETAAFIMEDAGGGKRSPSASKHYCTEAFKETLNYWQTWIGRSNYRGRWREMVNRSALTLKLLTSARHGSIVAAPTFGIPEEVGGVRNWDYRFTWIRDASFTLYALMRLGYTSEAAAFMRWIEHRCQELGSEGTLQVLYGIDGRHKIDEKELNHWTGYRKSRPVRIGNAAYNQLQLDIYGELMDSVYLYNKYGEPISCAPSGMWNAFHAPEIITKHGSCSRKPSATQTTWDYTPRNWAGGANISEIIRKRSPTWL